MSPLRTPGTAGAIENRLRSFRVAEGLSQGALAGKAGITRQAIYAIEANHYLPTTAVALRLAHALRVRVEDLFRLEPSGEVIQGEWVGPGPIPRGVEPGVRVKVAQVRNKLLVRPVADLGEVLSYAVAADGLLLPSPQKARARPSLPKHVQVRLLQDRQGVEGTVVVAGCDPAMFLLSDYLRRRKDRASVVGWTMGSLAALEALKRGEVHIAGLHIVDPKSGISNVPFLQRHLKGKGAEFRVVTFASWEQGLVLKSKNPKGIRSVEDIARPNVTLMNREPGSGARMLLDTHLGSLGIKSKRITGYSRLAGSHLEVARRVHQEQADVGVATRSAARLLGLDFIPLQEERYDLVFPVEFLDRHPSLSMFLDVLVSSHFRVEMEAIGGYDTRETGNIVDWTTSPQSKKSSKGNVPLLR